MTGSSLQIDISKVNNGERNAVKDHVAVEEPLEIQLTAPTPELAAAKSISITMRTPGHDEELALGFLLSEAIITGVDDVDSASPAGEPDPDSGLQNTVRVALKPGVEVDLERLQRHFYTTSSCGVCSKTSIDALRVSVAKAPPHDGVTYDRELIESLPDKLLHEQQLFSQTGGLHAAAVFDQAGNLQVVREDVGRHNAVDKVIGSLLTAGALPARDKGLLVSGRASFELVQKALVAGIATLVAVSAPSSLAVALADEYGMTLIGFLRGSSFNIYTGERRITE